MDKKVDTALGKKNRIVAIQDEDTGYEFVKNEFNKGRKFCLNFEGFLAKKCKQPKVD